MSLTRGSLWLFKFVPDEFVTHLPPQCISNYLEKLIVTFEFFTLYVQRGRFANESGANLRLIAAFEIVGDRQQLLFRLAIGAEGVVDFKNAIVRYRGQLGGALEVHRQPVAARVFGNRGL